MTKSVSAGYEQGETRHTRKPVEAYRFWRDGGTNWRYTNGDRPIIYDGHKYKPAAIARGTAQWNEKLEVSSLDMEGDHALGPLLDYIAQNPVEIIWVQILRLFRDQTPKEAGVIFIGQVKEVGIQKSRIKVNCVGMEFFLKQQVPIPRYQPPCNNDLFDSRCGLTEATYTISSVTLATVSADGLTLTTTNATLAAKAAGWCILGHVEYEDAQRMIVDHTAAAGTVTLKLRYKIVGLAAGDAITVCAGCDKKTTTCRDRFSNLKNYFGMPYIPPDNPCTRIP